jgi:ankyrin repeat protein
MCRAGYLGHTNVVSLLLKYGGDINLRSSDGRTALMWASFRNNGKMCDFLLDHNAEISLVDNEGWNALDIAIIKMNYESAIVLKRRGLVPRDQDFYVPHLWRKYDIAMFLENLEANHDTIDYKRLFDLIKSKLLSIINFGIVQQEEWQNRDLVVDTRETWKSWISR